MNPNPQSLDARCSKLRIDIKSVTADVATLKGELLAKTVELQPSSDAGEIIANVTLAYRHLEDAAMRLGKAIQAYDGGISVYDKNDAARVGVPAAPAQKQNIGGAVAPQA